MRGAQPRSVQLSLQASCRLGWNLFEGERMLSSRLKLPVDSAGTSSRFVDSVNVSATQACSALPPSPRDFFTLTPCRLVDTRLPANAPALQPIAQRTFPLTGTCSLP